MKKKTIVLSAILSISMTVPAFAGIGVSIDGAPVHFTAQSGKPVIDENNRTLVPLRAAMEAFGCSVSWNEPTKTALVAKGNTLVSVPVGQSILYKDGITVQNDTAAKIIDGRVYLPIRSVLEAFGASVGWDNSKQFVTVYTSGSAMPKPLPSKPSAITSYETEINYLKSNGKLKSCPYMRIANTVEFPDEYWFYLNKDFDISTLLTAFPNINSNNIHSLYDKENQRWSIAYRDKTFELSNYYQKGLFVSESVRICAYAKNGASYINISDLLQYLNIPSPSLRIEYDNTVSDYVLCID